MGEPRNVFARNWGRATVDVTVGNPWRLSASRRSFRVFIAGPDEHSYRVGVGPIALCVWVKSASPVALRQLGMDAGGCTESCSEMHTFSWPCELSMVDESYRPRRRRRPRVGGDR